MRSDLQLIQSAIADFDFNKLENEYLKDSKYFNLYNILLPSKFKGLPSKWYFAILPQQGEEGFKLLNKDEIISEGNSLISELIENDKLPLVILSDDIRLNAVNEFRNVKEAVFFINKTFLPGQAGAAQIIRNTPIIQAAKAKLEKENYALYLSPYTPNIPVDGWKFFGRQKILNQVTQSKANVFLLGSRKIGKTSVLLEAEAQLKALGFSVLHVGVQYLQNFGAVVNAMVSQLSSRDAYYAQRDTNILDSHFLLNVLKRLKGDKKKFVIVLDEIGNVMRKDPRNAWNFFGVLRDLSHTGEIRVLASAFQEVYIRTYKDHDSPLLNFGNMIEINLFSKHEVEELLINPLSVWYEVEDKNELLSFIRKKFGFHPLILQYLGEYIYIKIFNSSNKRVSHYLNKILNEDLDYFKGAHDEIYKKNHDTLEKYVYVKWCFEARDKNIELSAIELRQTDLEIVLRKFTITSSLEERTYFLERLSLKGLFYQEESNRLQFKIATPIIYYYIEAHNNIEELLFDWEYEIPNIKNNIRIDYQDEGS
ncbi:MAG TPA: hypothetical protein VKT28_19350 [Puia sp.]|nr:hypothetical protein [Puia sp.]